MKVAVCTPWTESGCPWRLRAKIYTRVFWWNENVDVAYGIDDSMPVNRAACRNRAAEATDADVLFFCDADMWVPIEQFRQACDLAVHTGRMVLAYDSHMRLNKHSTQAITDGKPHRYEGQTIKGTPGGAFAVTRELYEAAGGHDERFTGWGYEDRCFQYACDTVAGPGSRIPGVSFHLFHPRGADQIRTMPERRTGAQLALRYKRASGVKQRGGIVPPTRDAELNRDAMLAILREDGGPLAARSVSLAP